MALSVLVFVWAGLLGSGDLVAFAWICALSGLALGADLALPPSILADVIARDEVGAGTYFGWWNFVAKLNLALAAGLSLPVLALLGYEPGVASEAGQRALAWIYAGVPAVLKLCALALLWRVHRAISPA
jgi:GPH family glycoside/pentoside/hexuronide:cation symporter